MIFNVTVSPLSPNKEVFPFESNSLKESENLSYPAIDLTYSDDDEDEDEDDDEDEDESLLLLVQGSSEWNTETA
ncbi:hypothetical protein F2P81_005063 [Scophthalmus maximus]|uniref:Uncharacterized protein n=1 Tax=Scophthalmus maximus TaxID=52904 RepID=A0A6A4T848_SCOMX|nr:hypothetical protein F2P81_005063 [Scophthalmus maximus]